MNIFVKNIIPNNPYTMSLVIQEDTTLSELKYFLSNQLKLPEKLFYIMFNSKILSNDVKLADYGIVIDSTLLLNSTLGYEPYIKTSSYDFNYEYEYDNYD